MTSVCRSCLRPKTYCDDCNLRSCRLLHDALAELRSPVETRRYRINQPSFKERSARYLAIVRNASAPLTAREIDPKNTICTRALKYWTLRKMVKVGALKTIRQGNLTLFATPNTTT